ncbi:MAG: cytochrome-c peroxidase [Geminicoccaceae bacterium]|nr:cytochrome-c peroxidase [Geminicoccaceae bacterium]MCX7629288.1 cytochrome-c peroxidase [Geminicoccaceae bacterium]MDW8125595.1 cytochrome-c peroxidase [Geminicoccaceae bacterium]
MKRWLAAGVAALWAGFFAVPVAADALLEKARALFRPIPAKPPELPGNPATVAKVELGKMLFFEPRLSAEHNISCATCHQIGLGGADGRPVAIGHNWQRTTRNTPTILNAVFNTAQSWDGRARDLAEQSGRPITSAIAMGNTREGVVATLRAIPGYRSFFAWAFPGEAEPITFENIEKALAVFQAALITPDAPFDRYLAGDETALSAEEKEGLALFIDKGCASCHQGVNLGGDRYAPFGVVQRPGAEFLPPDDKGRLMVTRTPDDAYTFKVPSLRNVALTAPYFHSGSSWDLEQAVAVMGTAQLGIELTPAETRKIAAFLVSLTGRQPSIVLPVLPPSVPSTPRPKS